MALNQANIKRFTQKSKEKGIFLALRWTILSFEGMIQIGVSSDIYLDLINQYIDLLGPSGPGKKLF